MDLEIFKKLLHVNKDISRITIDLYSIKKLLSSDISIIKILNEYQLELDKILDDGEIYLLRFANIIKEIENRQKKATPIYNLILQNRKEYLTKTYDDYCKHFENYLSHRNSVNSKENINQIKKIIEGIIIPSMLLIMLSLTRITILYIKILIIEVVYLNIRINL